MIATSSLRVSIAVAAVAAIYYGSRSLLASYRQSRKRRATRERDKRFNKWQREGMLS